MDIDLPKAQTIANAVGNTGWNMSKQDYNGWFYFDKNGSTYGQIQVANSSKPSSSSSSSSTSKTDSPKTGVTGVGAAMAVLALAAASAYVARSRKDEE